MAAEVLYTPEVLVLATSLAEWPLDPALPLRAQASSRACGSVLTLGLALDAGQRIARVGLQARACAIGQAAAAIFARGALGHDAAAIAAAGAALDAWLAGEVPLPDWPGLAAIAAARAYPGRHGAIALPWRAACECLPTP